MNPVLTIAGSDCSGGAGIQADLKTFGYHNCFGMSVITAITSQNTLGVTGIHPVPIDMIEKQLDAVFTDIFPKSIKIGMVATKEVIATITSSLQKYNAKNIVVDPVMVSTSGSQLITDEAIDTLKKLLFPIADVITPNIYEAEILAGMKIKNKEDMIKASHKLRESYNGVIMIKGGHLNDEASDLILIDNDVHWLTSKRYNNPNTHGTGCTLSSAIASNLANGYQLLDSIKNAKEYITNAISMNLNLGQGRGPLNHNPITKDCSVK